MAPQSIVRMLAKSMMRLLALSVRINVNRHAAEMRTMMEQLIPHLPRNIGDVASWTGYSFIH